MEAIRARSSISTTLPACLHRRPPYRQAFDRGLIGATAHFVTDDLDEGPIVEQDVIHVDHTFSADDMAKAGRDGRKSVLEPGAGTGAERAGLRLRQQDRRVQISGCAPLRLRGSLFIEKQHSRVQRQTIDGHDPFVELELGLKL